MPSENSKEIPRKNARNGQALQRLSQPSGLALESTSPGATPSTAGSGAAFICEASGEPLQWNLRQKLAEVRRRIGYVQKRGHNEIFNYSYVAAADIAGAVGDILSQLGVLLVPSLESIAYEPARVTGAHVERVAHLIMTYTFTDVDTGEALTVKIPGEGLDIGDKATYKAMTGALKYALLQSFLLATGDDPEDERMNAMDRSVTSSASTSERVISEKELDDLRRLIEVTGTDLDRVLSYYKLCSLEEMTQSTYHRALELLKRKQAKQNGGESGHAQN
jgi:hypothetical protein